MSVALAGKSSHFPNTVAVNHDVDQHRITSDISRTGPSPTRAASRNDGVLLPQGQHRPHQIRAFTLSAAALHRRS